MVAGLPGTGKSTLAAALSEKLQGAHLNTDKIRHELGMQGKYDEASKAYIYKELYTRTAAFLQGGGIVVVDGTFYQESLRLEFCELARQTGVQVVWIEVRAGEDTVRKRMQIQRQYSEADFGVYLAIREKFEPLSGADHLTLWSDRLTLEEMVRETEQYLMVLEKLRE